MDCVNLDPEYYLGLGKSLSAPLVSWIVALGRHFYIPGGFEISDSFRVVLLMGSSSVKVLPFPLVLLTVISPFIKSTSSFISASPMPVPPLFLVEEPSV